LRTDSGIVELGPEVESGVYYCCLETIQNATKPACSRCESPIHGSLAAVQGLDARAGDNRVRLTPASEAIVGFT
jgi:hypothetical protein